MWVFNADLINKAIRAIKVKYKIGGFGFEETLGQEAFH